MRKKVKDTRAFRDQVRIFSLLVQKMYVLMLCYLCWQCKSLEKSFSERQEEMLKKNAELEEVINQTKKAEVDVRKELHFLEVRRKIWIESPFFSRPGFLENICLVLSLIAFFFLAFLGSAGDGEERM